MGVGGDFNERAKCHIYDDLTTKLTNNTKSKFVFQPLHELRVLRGDLKQTEGAQVLAWFIKAAATEGSDVFAPRVDPLRGDLPFAPGKNRLVERKGHRPFILEPLEIIGREVIPALANL